MERTTAVLSKHAIAHRLVFILCFPTETMEDVEQTFRVIDTISKSNNYIMIAIVNLIPLPGTTVFELLTSSYNYKAPSTLEGWGSYKWPPDLEDVTWVSKEHAV